MLGPKKKPMSMNAGRHGRGGNEDLHVISIEPDRPDANMINYLQS
jgi:hypothetical protein